MRYIKLIIIAAFLSTMFTGCSYVSDMAEGAITERASFSVTANYNSTTHVVNLSWDKTDSSNDFAGIEIYVTSKPNDEYASYELVASKDFNNINLESPTTTSYTYTLTAFTIPTFSTGTYFYRVGIINWDDEDSSDYNTETNIDAISGYAKVVIP